MTLDPRDWLETRTVAHRMVDDMLAYLETVAERAPWRPVPDEVRARLAEPVPFDGSTLADVYEAFLRDVLPYPTGNIHPRFWGWVMGTGTATGMLAEMLAAGMNAHVAGYDQAASLVERQVLAWLRELMGFPPDASGVLVSGGTEANLNGLMAARVARAGFDVRSDGLLAGPALAVYGSSETHSWIIKACESMGMGHRAFRSIPVDAAYRIDLVALRRTIEADLASGLRPFAIIGNAGTVNTGAVDDLARLRSVADDYGLWLHVDGAFGALAAWTRSRALVAGQELADSLAFDLHKWGYMPYEIGVILVRDPAAQVATYGRPGPDGPSYLRSAERGIAAETTYFADRGIQLSRGFRALKAWMSLKEQGVDRIGEAIQRNIEQAQRLGMLVAEHPDLELLAPVSLNIVCFRWRADARPATLDRLNQQILVELQVRGIAVPSQTVLDGRFAIRVCITNHRTTDADLDALVAGVTDIAHELQADGPAGPA
jgi:glutamate/tyrosine decarboxylase-like PLP-dependent enzyme